MDNKKKVLIITGPTATGKTSFAVTVAQNIPAVLISADSRQIYKGLDVVIGKDHPKGMDMKCINLITPKSRFSVADWLSHAAREIQEAWKREELPVLVGGTGLYIKALTEGIDSLGVPPDGELRKELESLSTQDLQRLLKNLSPEKYQSLNNSDKNNPRRLVRRIELARAKKEKSTRPLGAQYKIIALKPPGSYKQTIRQRVKKRLESGHALEETQTLLQEYGKANEALTGIGYAPIIEYLEGKITMPELVRNWALQECQYAKRQMTWFKKQNLEWVNNQEPEERSQVVKRIKTWYHEK